VIALTHLPIADEIKLMETVPGIDLCLAGHDHILYSDIINGNYLIEGYVDLQQLAVVTVNFNEYRQLGAVSFRYIPVDNTTTHKDPEMQNIVNQWVLQFNKEGKIIVGNTLVLLMGNETFTRCKESNTGNLVTDVIRNWTMDALKGFPVLPVLSVINSGGLRWTTDIVAGTDLTKQIILDLLPYGNLISVITISGLDLRLVLEASVSSLPSTSGSYLQVSGFSFTVNCNIQSANNGQCYSNPYSRVGNITLSDENGGIPVKDSEMYYLALPNFLQSGGDKYSIFLSQTIIIDPDNTITIFDALIKYIEGEHYISPMVEGRIQEVSGMIF